MSKPHMIEVRGPELVALLAIQEELDAPFVVEDHGAWRVEAQSLKQWRESARAKEGKQGDFT